MPDAAVKNGWHLRRFDEMAVIVNDRVDDPAKAGVDRYVGLEHLDSNSLTIRRWGSPDDVEATKLRFRAGDIIFGRRRVYQRKLGVADFDGICSAHAMVLRAQPPAALPEFLPFFMQSDLFMERAKEISVGSLSPTINWKTLAKEQFILPPLGEQRRIAAALLALSDAADSYRTLGESIATVLRAATENLCWAAGWPHRQVATIAASGHFTDGDWIESKDQAPEGVRLLQLADIGDGLFLDKSRRYVSNETFSRLGCKEVFAGDLLIARMAEPIGRTCTVPQLGIRCITAVDCCIARVDEEEHDARYWLYALNSPSWTRLVDSAAAGSTRSRISRTNLETIMVPVPKRGEQAFIAAQLASIEDLQRMAVGRATALRGMARDMMASLLGDTAT